MRQDSEDRWPTRPWIMVMICAVSGLIFHFLIDAGYDSKATPARNAVATFVAIATVASVLTVEQRRLLTSLSRQRRLFIDGVRYPEDDR